MPSGIHLALSGCAAGFALEAAGAAAERAVFCPLAAVEAFEPAPGVEAGFGTDAGAGVAATATASMLCAVSARLVAARSGNTGDCGDGLPLKAAKIRMAKNMVSTAKQPAAVHRMKRFHGPALAESGGALCGSGGRLAFGLSAESHRDDLSNSVTGSHAPVGLFKYTASAVMIPFADMALIWSIKVWPVFFAAVVKMIHSFHGQEHLANLRSERKHRFGHPWSPANDRECA